MAGVERARGRLEYEVRTVHGETDCVGPQRPHKSEWKRKTLEGFDHRNVIIWLLFLVITINFSGLRVDTKGLVRRLMQKSR